MYLWAIIALAVAALLTAYGAVIQAVRYNAAVISRFPRRTVSYNFDGLTHDQATLLTFGGWTPESRPRRRPGTDHMTGLLRERGTPHLVVRREAAVHEFQRG